MVPSELSGNMAVSLLRRAGINSYRLFLSRKLRSSFHPAITREALRKITAKKVNAVSCLLFHLSYKCVYWVSSDVGPYISPALWA